MYFHICILFLKLCICLTIHSTFLMLYSYNITYLIMLITNYDAIRIPICTVVWLLNKTYSLSLKKTFQLYASFLTNDILYTAWLSIILKNCLAFFLISCLFLEIFRYFWFLIVSFIKTFKVICKCNDIGNAHMQSIQIKWKNCLVDFKYLENSPNYESEDSSTLRWLLYFFKIACISFPKVFPSL